MWPCSGRIERCWPPTNRSGGDTSRQPSRLSSPDLATREPWRACRSDPNLRPAYVPQLLLNVCSQLFRWLVIHQVLAEERREIGIQLP